MLRPGQRAAAAGTYLAAVLLLTAVAPADSTLAFWLRGLILMPTALGLYFIDYAVGIILFGPDPERPGATAFFYATATGAVVLQLSLARALLDQRRGRRPLP